MCQCRGHRFDPCGLGRFHMLWDAKACSPQPLKPERSRPATRNPQLVSPCAAAAETLHPEPVLRTTERPAHRNDHQPHMETCKTTGYHRNSNQDDSEIPPHTGQNGYHQKNPQATNAGEGVERKKPSCTVGRNVKWCSHDGEQDGGSLKN